MSQFRDAYAEFRRLQTQVAGVSVDSPYAHREWARQLTVPFPLVSDFARTLLRSYDALRPDLEFLPDTAGYHAFLIDARCRLRAVWYQGEDGTRAGIDEVLEATRAVIREELA